MWFSATFIYKLGEVAWFSGVVKQLGVNLMISVIIFSSGYVSMEDLWVMGFIMSVVNLTIWGVVGGLWWKLLGYR
ncbi:anion permease [Shewanella frigidimarina]|uniref:anion permease n=1 Tax=Shewanella frigidimarina TaxID=56812 RepID=UPI001FE0B85D|nr:anion permease [Shewanella frigidimarina]